MQTQPRYVKFALQQFRTLLCKRFEQTKLLRSNEFVEAQRNRMVVERIVDVFTGCGATNIAGEFEIEHDTLAHTALPIVYADNRFDR